MIQADFNSDWLKVIASKFPNKIAFFADENAITFSEFNGRVNTAKRNMALHKYHDEKFIGIKAENSIEYLITVSAAMRFGIAPVLFSTRWTKKECVEIQSRFQLGGIIEQNDLEEICAEDEWKYSKNIELQSHITSELTEDKPALVVFTSGSTGSAKGVVTSFGNIFSSVHNSDSFDNYTTNDNFISSLPFYHIGGIMIFFRALLCGAELTVVSPHTERIITQIERDRPSIISLVPIQLNRIINQGIKPNKKLRSVYIGGGPSESELITKALNKNWPIVKVYGSTETTSMISAVSGEELKKNTSSSGRVFEKMKVSIANQNSSGSGEICISGQTLSKGYFDPSRENKMDLIGTKYISGDFGFIKDGLLFIESRRSDIVLSGGENINIIEVENALLKLNYIGDCSVFSLPDDEWGQIVCAAIVTQNNSIVDLQRIKLDLQAIISSYKIPKKIFCVESIPRTELGKVDLHKMKTNLNLDEV